MEQQQTNFSNSLLIGLVIAGVLLLAGGFYGYDYYIKYSSEQLKNKLIEERREINQKIGDSLIRQDPNNLQEYFLNDVKKGENNPLSKAAIYFITHRFFDNGGNINEIKSYVNNNPELSFLSNAKNIYPEIFAKLDNGEKITKTESLLAYLAYLEALSNAGYADMAAYSTASAKYAELYYFDSLNGEPEEKIKMYKEKSVAFAELSKPMVERTIEEGKYFEEQYSMDDVLVGLTQYGHALAFFKKFKVNYNSKYTFEQVFDFAIYYSSTNRLVLDPFTRLSYAYTLVFTDSISAEKIQKVGLGSTFKTTFRKLDYVKEGIVDKLINGNKKGYNPDGIFGQNTITKISEYDKDFKEFLVARNYEFKAK